MSITSLWGRDNCMNKMRLRRMRSLAQEHSQEVTKPRFNPRALSLWACNSDTGECGWLTPGPQGPTRIQLGFSPGSSPVPRPPPFSFPIPHDPLFPLHLTLVHFTLGHNSLHCMPWVTEEIWLAWGRPRESPGPTYTPYLPLQQVEACKSAGFCWKENHRACEEEPEALAVLGFPSHGAAKSTGWEIQGPQSQPRMLHWTHPL